MDKIISPFQNAFIKGRLISDNIFMASETMSVIHNAKKGKSSWGALKLDLAKAYDRVDWAFLQAVLKRMNFPDLFIRCIMNCISNARFSLLLNGQVSVDVSVGRGLRQGDPLSPYLFILCMNVFSCVLADAEREGKIQGIRFARRGPSISHLLYADDLILFFTANNNTPVFLKTQLEVFCDMAGLRINTQKSNMVLSPNTPASVKEDLERLFGVDASNKLGKYLGVFVDDKQDIKRNFDDLLHKINNRFAGWKSQLLSQAGRVTLIKSVIQSDPVYKLSCFQAPKRVTEAINGAMTNFFWGFRGDKRRCHLLNKKILFTPKHDGGLGFRDTAQVNKALLAKHTWRMLNNPQSVVAEWVRNRYLVPYSDFDFKSKSVGSIVWKGVRNSSHVITENVRWKLGMGDKVDIRSAFWDDRIDGRPTGILVSDLLDYSTYSWDAEKISLICAEDQAANLIRTPGPIRHIPDTLIWSPVTSGSYSTADGFKFLSSGNHPGVGNNYSSHFPWKDFWRTKAPMRVLLTVWKIYKDAIPTFTNLNRHHLRCDIVCHLCGASDDSVSHTFLQCSFARAVWFGLPLTFRYHPSRGSFRTWLTSWILRWKRDRDRFSEAWLTILVGLNAIWRCRNDSVWRNAKSDPMVVIDSIKFSVSYYVSVYDGSFSFPSFDFISHEFLTSSSHDSGGLHALRG